MSLAAVYGFYNILLVIHLFAMGLVSYGSVSVLGEKNMAEDHKLNAWGTIWSAFAFALVCFRTFMIYCWHNNAQIFAFHELRFHTADMFEGLLYYFLVLAYFVSWIAWIGTRDTIFLSVSLAIRWVSSLYFLDGLRQIHH